jgi:hypothetical protein
MVASRTMHHQHPYAVQAAAFYLSLVPFVLLGTMIAGARFFDRAHRARKPSAPRPAIVGLTRAANSAN